MIYDVAVVGAGPTGLICASELEKLGEKTIVIEEDKIIGEPVECAGLFNISGLKRLGIKKGDYVLNKVKGAKVIASSGASANIGGKEDKALVVDRGEFDRFLAKEYNGELVLGKKVTDIHGKSENYEIDFGRKIEAKRVVLATGYNPSLHKSLDFSGPSEYISTSQYEIQGINADPDFVELYVGSVAPGFFAWVIPVNEDVSRIGLGVMNAKESTHYYMESFLKRLKAEERFKEKNKVIHRSGGLVPLFEPTQEVAHKNAYLVGDAATHVKATTGGGVMIGGLAAKALAKAIHTDTNYGVALVSIAKELNDHLMVRRVINRFGDTEYEHMIEFLNKPEIKKLVEENGDMDFISPLMGAVMKNPGLMMQAMKVFGKALF